MTGHACRAQPPHNRAIELAPVHEVPQGAHTAEQTRTRGRVTLARQVSHCLKLLVTGSLDAGCWLGCWSHSLSW